jgi:hypothetical protein
MQDSTIFQRAFLIVFILLSGCGSPPDVQVNELSSNTASYDETIHINNCGSKADSEQAVSHSFATNIDGGVQLGIRQIVEGSISAKYSQYQNISKSQKLIAPPGTNMEFVLRWSEEVHAGNVTVNGSTRNYEVRVPVAVEQVSSRDLGGCGNVSAPTIPVPLSTQPQEIPESVSSLCPSVISRRTIEQWAQAGEISKPQAQTYIDDFDRMRKGGEYTIGTVLPAGVAIVTDFGNGESDIYLTLPVKGIAHYHSWGVFEVTSEYQAIQTGSCMTIVP